MTIIENLSDVEYHADLGSLSSSGARAILASPAQFRYDQDHPRESTDAFDLGHAAHTLVLGKGAPLVAVPFDDWRSKAAREERDTIRADGGTPLLQAQYDQVHAMAAKVRDHEDAARILADGHAEWSGYWDDPDTGVRLRFRMDWHTTIGGQFLIADYKTTAGSADPVKFARSAVDFGYHQQQPWYEDGAKETGLSDDPAFCFIVQSKIPPYLVSVVELDPADVELGRRLNRKAIDLYARCVRENHWPAWEGIHSVSLPAWAVKQLEEKLA